jgi:hypothetical protein
MASHTGTQGYAYGEMRKGNGAGSSETSTTRHNIAEDNNVHIARRMSDCQFPQKYNVATFLCTVSRSCGDRALRHGG